MAFYAQIDREFMEGPEPSNIGEQLGLDEDQAIGKAARFFGWSIEAAAPDGIVRGEGAVRAIERAAGWTGPRGKLVEAFTKAGILQQHADGIRVRGWVERYGTIHDQARTERAQHAAHVRWGKVVAGCAACDALRNAASMRAASPEQSPKQSAANAPAMPDPDPDPDLDPNQDPEPPPTPSAPDGAKGAAVEVVYESVTDRDSSGIPRTMQRPRVRWEPTDEGCWAFIQHQRGAAGLGEEERRTGKEWTKFTTWFARAMEGGGQDAIADIVNGFLRDPTIRTPGWPTSVLIKAWDVRLEAWKSERAA